MKIYSHDVSNPNKINEKIDTLPHLSYDEREHIIFRIRLNHGELPRDRMLDILPHTQMPYCFKMGELLRSHSRFPCTDCNAEYNITAEINRDYFCMEKCQYDIDLRVLSDMQKEIYMKRRPHDKKLSDVQFASTVHGIFIDPNTLKKLDEKSS